MIKKLCIITITLIAIISCSKNNNLEIIINKNMANIKGTIVFLELTSNKKIVYNSNLANTKTTPCSTFKIWNTLIGIENNLIFSEDDSFYKWDGITRSYRDWNQDLTLREAFQFSCVPAYQILAIKIGLSNMKFWIDKINYGDKDISSGLDIFWLPKPNKKSIKISPMEQASLIKKLVNNQLSFSSKSKKILKNIMRFKTTENGTLYGKTGSGQNIDDIPDDNIGWYVGYIISNNGKFAFTCFINDKEATGKKARELVEKILIESTFM